MSDLVDRIEAMARLYRGYDRQLAEWLESLDAVVAAADQPATGLAPAPPADESRSPSENAPLLRLARLEESFIGRARVLGESVEKERARLSRAAGRDLTIREAVARTGDGAAAEKACDEAASAVEAVARRRVGALRRLEAFREDIRGGRGRLAAARRLGKMYYRRREQGRRVDGSV